MKNRYTAVATNLFVPDEVVKRKGRVSWIGGAQSFYYFKNVRSTNTFVCHRCTNFEAKFELNELLFSATTVYPTLTSFFFSLHCSAILTRSEKKHGVRDV